MRERAAVGCSKEGVFGRDMNFGMSEVPGAEAEMNGQRHRFAQPLNVNKKFNSSSILLLSIVLAHSPVVAQELSALRAAAEKGEATAQLEYGKAIESKSREEAAQWIQKAANQGSGEAWYWLGYAGLGADKPAAYYEKAAETGYFKAFPSLLDHLLFRAGPSADVVKAKKFADLVRKLPLGQRESLSSGQLETVDRCFEAGVPVIPKSDLPSSEEKKSYREAECSSYQMGVGAAQDWSRYRKCVLSQAEVDHNRVAEIYANGWGVKRHAKLAIALVCHGSSVPAELEGMVVTLFSTREQDHLENEFSFCDHVTSGMNGGLCAARREAIISQRREREVVELIRNWTRPQQVAFQSLSAVGDLFFSARAESEQDLSGTARAQLVIDEEGRLREEFLNSVKSFEKGQFPSDSDFVQADKELNEVYSKFMKSELPEDFGTITKDSIKRTQRKWIQYRDAWIAFAALKYPHLAQERLNTFLTRQRSAHLKALLELL